MASGIGPPAPIEYHHITNKGSSRTHLGNNYTSNVYYTSTQGSGDEGSKTQALIECLWYPEIRQREDQIHDADESEYDWAFEVSSTALAPWLTAENGIFWVAGKAGSGKSTFMKFLRHHNATERLLEQWSGCRKLIIAAYYFWHSSIHRLQRSREGLYRSVLYQALDSLPSGLASEFSEKWKSMRKGSTDRAAWSNKELLRGFYDLFTLPNTAFVFFIDGLDECDPSSEHSTLVTELETFAMSENVKICVSSRPWKPFEPRFRNPFFRLNLHNLTRPDIVRYISVELAKAERDAGLNIGLYEDYCIRSEESMSTGPRGRLNVIEDDRSEDEAFNGNGSEVSSSEEEQESNDFSGRILTYDGSKLVRLIVKRCEGVFLWVHLILRDLRNEILAGKELGELHGLIRETPSDLMQYYELSIRKRIGWQRETQVAMALKIAIVLGEAGRDTELRGRGFMSFLHFSVLQRANQLEDPHFGMLMPIQVLSDDDIRKMLSIARAFLGEVCKDLVRVEDSVHGKHAYKTNFEFLHRSVLEYLTEATTLSWIHERVPNHFKMPGFFLELTLARMKLVPATANQSEKLCDELSKTLADVLKIINGRIVLPIVEVASGDMKVGLSHQYAELIRQFEDIAVRYLRLSDFDDLPDPLFNPLAFMKSIEKCATLFLTLGYTQFLSEACARHPSLNFGPLKQDAFLEIFPQLFTNQADQNVHHAVKVMFDLGFSCGILPWHHMLYHWWHSNNVHERDAELGDRAWQISKLLLLDGVDMSTMVCLAHPPHWEACAFSKRTDDNASCSLRAPASVLSELVAEKSRVEFLSVLSKYEDEPRLMKLNEYHRKKRVAWYRKALERTPPQPLDLPNADSSYTKWVQSQEGRLELLYKLNYRYVAHQMLETAICHNCEVDILKDGCFRWLCLSCLGYDYCTLCLPTARKTHVGPFQCMERWIANLQIEAMEEQLRYRDKNTSSVERAPFPSEELAYCVGRATSGWTEAFESGIRNHESTKNMSREDAVVLVTSIIQETVGAERDYDHLNIDSNGCEVTQIRPLLEVKSRPQNKETPREQSATYRLVVDI